MTHVVSHIGLDIHSLGRIHISKGHAQSISKASRERRLKSPLHEDEQRDRSVSATDFYGCGMLMGFLIETGILQKAKLYINQKN